MKLNKEDFVVRISNASPVQLLVITYELVIVNIEDAKNSNDDNSFEMHIKKAQDFLMQLMTSLDMAIPISNNLLNIYLYINKLLHECYFSKDIEALDDCLEMLSSLCDSFVTICKENEENSILKSSQQIYAGLTYSNSALDEFVIEDSSRGYKA